MYHVYYIKEVLLNIVYIYSHIAMHNATYTMVMHVDYSLHVHKRSILRDIVSMRLSRAHKYNNTLYYLFSFEVYGFVIVEVDILQVHVHGTKYMYYHNTVFIMLNKLDIIIIIIIL